MLRGKEADAWTILEMCGLRPQVRGLWQGLTGIREGGKIIT